MNSLASADRRIAWILGAAFFISYAYFYQAGGWGENSRFAMIRAILERHTVQIDDYSLHTGDLAIWNGHFYTDKAPGASLLALIPVALARGIDRLVGVDPQGYPGLAWTSYVAAVSTSGIFTVVAALSIFWLGRRWGYSRGASCFAATAYGVATPAWCYATLFMGHAPAAGCLALGFAAAWATGDPANQRPLRSAWIVGLACGWAVLTEFPSAVPVLFITGLSLSSARAARPQDWPQIVGRVLAGGAIVAALLLAYNVVSFGSPFRFGYLNEADPRYYHMREGFFGIALPRVHVLGELLFGRYRGLLPIAPLIAVTPIGLLILGRTDSGYRAAWTAAAIAVFYFLMNASYFLWDGGAVYGPRHVIPSLPFLSLGLLPLWEHGRTIGRVLLTAGWVWGAAVTLIAVSTFLQPPANTLKDPVWELMWPAFRDGDLSLSPQTMVSRSIDTSRLRGRQQRHAAWNLGEIAGLHGHATLVPLGVVWLAAFFLCWPLVSADRRSGQEVSSSGAGARSERPIAGPSALRR